MNRVRWSRLKYFIYDLIHASGLSQENAKTMAEVFIRATARGVGHHDIYDLPGRLKAICNGDINANPQIRLLNKFAALESYSGDNGPGEVCCFFAMERAKRLADEYGIGLCSISDSNHYLASAPYIEKAVEEGYLAVLFTKGGPIMGAPGRPEKVMGFGAATDKDYPILLDICLSYISYGALGKRIKLGQKVPSHWGFNREGNPTTDPAELMEGTIAPIGGHKGFGLSMLGEILTGILSGGQVIDEPHPLSGKVAVACQAAIAMKPDGLMSPEEFRKRTTEMIDRMEKRAPGLRIPGENSARNRKEIEEKDEILLEAGIIQELNRWAERLGVACLDTLD